MVPLPLSKCATSQTLFWQVDPGFLEAEQDNAVSVMEVFRLRCALGGALRHVASQRWLFVDPTELQGLSLEPERRSYWEVPWVGQKGGGKERSCSLNCRAPLW